jgi:hypothetical protein
MTAIKIPEVQYQAIGKILAHYRLVALNYEAMTVLINFAALIRAP